MMVERLPECNASLTVSTPCMTASWRSRPCGPRPPPGAPSPSVSEQVAEAQRVRHLQERRIVLRVGQHPLLPPAPRGLGMEPPVPPGTQPEPLSNAGASIAFPVRLRPWAFRAPASTLASPVSPAGGGSSGREGHSVVAGRRRTVTVVSEDQSRPRHAPIVRAIGA